MNPIFHNTLIYFRVYFNYETLNKDSFSRLCERLKFFHLKCPEIIGLYLSGDYFFKKILFSEEPINLSSEDADKIEEITPIILKRKRIPFIMENNYFEITVPTKDYDLEALMGYTSEIYNYLDTLFDGNKGKQVEIHLKRPKEKLSSILDNVVSCLPKGSYHYEVKKEGQVEKGELSLPTENILREKFGQMIYEGGESVFLTDSDDYFKLIENGNKFIVKSSTVTELKISLYSNQIEWFEGVLKAFNENGLFEPGLFPTLTIIESGDTESRVVNEIQPCENDSALPVSVNNYPNIHEKIPLAA